MALPKPEPGFVCVMRDVPVTGTNHSVTYLTLMSSGHQAHSLKGERLLLSRDRTNDHDRNAVKVLNPDRYQLGWVGMRTGHSQAVAAYLDSKEYLGAYLLITHHAPNSDPMTRLRGDLYVKAMEPEPLKAGLNGPVVKVKGVERQGLEELVGQLLHLRTNSTRSSVSLVDGSARKHGWYYKSDSPYTGEPRGHAALVISTDKVMLISAAEAEQHGYKYADCTSSGSREAKVLEVSSLSAVGSSPGVLTSGEFSRLYALEDFDWNSASNRQIADAINTVNGAVSQTSVTPAQQTQTQTQPQPEKETIMSKIAQTATAVIESNKTAATQAGYLEAGRLANKQAAKLAGKHLPLMLRGYADTAVGQLVIANLAQIAVKQLRPNDPTLVKLTDAMVVQGFQALYQTVDLDSILDSLLSSPEMQRAVGKLGADE